MADLKNNSNNLLDQAVSFMRLDKSRRRWRLVAVVAVFFLLVTTLALQSTSHHVTTSPHVAQIQVEGIITDDLYQQNILKGLQEDGNVKAVVVYIDSPGGTMVGGINLYQSLRQIAAEKPVVTVMGTVAASAGYMVAAAGDHVIANPGSITGSIGVLMPLVDATELANKIGVKSDEVTSGNLKTATSPFSKRSQAERDYLKQTVLNMQEVFMALILAQRDLPETSITIVSDGRILTGAAAKQLGLVDALGGLNTAQGWLFDTHQIPKNTPFIEVSSTRPKTFLEHLIGGAQSLLFSKQSQQGIMAVLH